ncbi:MAG: NAD-dependent epimerase/dehydratase family protein [Propionibacterium sp.]|nr:NAD-dependent epimerase/dehydratase family protein [Propionibacterium sp.]
MRIAVTGADGFLGWHTRVRLRALTDHDVIPVGRDHWAGLPDVVRSADAVLHLAGVNRGSAEAVEEANVELASALAAAVRGARAPGGPRIVYADSIQRGNGTAYGNAKARAAAILAEAAEETGSGFCDVVLPNLFGEHGRPNYNSFVATFVHKVVTGEEVALQDREVELLHVQDAAQALLEALVGAGRRQVRPQGQTTSVAAVLGILTDQFAVYRRGEIPTLPSRMHVNLFNTLRASMFPVGYPIPLVRHTDARGSLVETVRAHGSQGQTFLSTTVPGVTRGQHFHLRKMERFVVVGGRARISLRRMLKRPVVEFEVDGATPVIVDMPTLWTHKITNIGASELTTMFWTNELFDPQNPDTYREDV